MLAIAVIVGVALFCFLQGYIITGIICLAGFSKKIGFIALAMTSILLLIRGHFMIGLLPLLLVGMAMYILMSQSK